MQKISLQSILKSFAVFMVMMLWLFVSPVTAFFWSILLIWTNFKLDSRIIGIGALVLLISIPLALSIELYEWMAEQLAVYVFYLLCITVFLQILELRRDTKNVGINKSDEAKNIINVRQKKEVRKRII